MLHNSLKILHIEDDIADAVLIKEALSQYSSSNDMHIKRVESMTDALKELYCEDYNLILLDLHLSDIHGLDNVRCIRGETPDLPIVVLTSVDNDKWAAEVLEAGAQEYVVKGNFNGPILNQIIKSSIRRKTIENKLYEKAYYDELTGLPNSLYFRDILKTMIARAKRKECQEALLFVDIQNFKNFNRTFGKEVGDVLLIETTKRLQESLRDGDIIVRYSGDTFAIHLDKANDDSIKSHCMIVSEKIQKILEQPFCIDGQDVKISVNIGIALYPDAGEDVKALIENTDVAMHFLKVNHKSSICFAKNLREQVSIEDLKTQSTH